MCRQSRRVTDINGRSPMRLERSGDLENKRDNDENDVADDVEPIDMPPLNGASHIVDFGIWIWD